MNSANDFKRIAEEALSKTFQDGQNHPIYIGEASNSPFSINVSNDIKIEKKESSSLYVAYDSIHKAKELWSSNGGLIVKEVVYGKKIGRQYELIKTNTYPNFELNWNNGDYVQVVNGEITKFKISK